jgi:hypothetical protein
VAGLDQAAAHEVGGIEHLLGMGLVVGQRSALPPAQTLEQLHQGSRLLGAQIDSHDLDIGGWHAGFSGVPDAHLSAAGSAHARRANPRTTPNQHGTGRAGVGGAAAHTLTSPPHPLRHDG